MINITPVEIMENCNYYYFIICFSFLLIDLKINNKTTTSYITLV